MLLSGVSRFRPPAIHEGTWEQNSWPRVGLGLWSQENLTHEVGCPGEQSESAELAVELSSCPAQTLPTGHLLNSSHFTHQWNPVAGWVGWGRERIAFCTSKTSTTHHLERVLVKKKIKAPHLNIKGGAMSRRQMPKSSISAIGGAGAQLAPSVISGVHYAPIVLLLNSTLAPLPKMYYHPDPGNVEPALRRDLA